MIHELVTLFNDQDYVELLRHSLPRAFEVADAESRRVQRKNGGKTYETVGQEVGVAREKILVAFLRHTLGDMHIHLPTANSSMRDVLIFQKPLEIKTATKNGLVTAKWTADPESVNRDIKGFEFDSDLLLVRIWWGIERDSLFYIPKEVLSEIAGGQDPAKFLSSAKGTNNRGIKISAPFTRLAEGHPSAVRIAIPWERRDIRVDPMGRWMAYWSDRGGRDPLYS